MKFRTGIRAHQTPHHFSDWAYRPWPHKLPECGGDALAAATHNVVLLPWHNRRITRLPKPCGFDTSNSAPDFA